MADNQFGWSGIAKDAFKIDYSGPDSSGGGKGGVAIIDRSKWKFDEDGFALATNAALLAAQQEMREKIASIHSDIVNVMHPSDYEVTVDGVPISKVNFEK
jgi:hypothetical protein